MKHWLLIASIAITGLFIAKATFDAGLKQFAYAIGLTGAVGWLLIGFDLFLVGGALLAISCGLVMVSRYQMKKHQIGPFVPAGKL